MSKDKKGIPKALVRSVMSLYKGANTRVKVDSESTEKFEAKLGVHQRTVLLPCLFQVVVDAT